MAYIFLSYAKADRDSALAIRGLLEREGLTLWMDENPDELAENQWATIQKNIRNAAAFILLVSDAAQQTDWLKRELAYAEEIHKPIFPILIEGTGWAGLNRSPAKLGLGLRLDIPDDFAAELQSLSKDDGKAVPLQIPSYEMAQEAAKRQRSFILWFGITGLLVLLMTIHGPGFFAGINAPNASSTPDNVYQTNSLAILEMTRTERAEVFAAQRTLDSQRRESTVAYNTAINETAQAGNGALPCRASIVPVDGRIRLQIYRSPNNMNSWAMNRNTDENLRLTLHEWISNDDGEWFYVSLENRPYIGYMKAEDLLLDINCPRLDE